MPFQIQIMVDGNKAHALSGMAQSEADPDVLPPLLFYHNQKITFEVDHGSAASPIAPPPFYSANM